MMADQIDDKEGSIPPTAGEFLQNPIGYYEQQSVLAWQRLLQQTGKTPEDIPYFREIAPATPEDDPYIKIEAEFYQAELSKLEKYNLDQKDKEEIAHRHAQELTEKRREGDLKASLDPLTRKLFNVVGYTDKLEAAVSASIRNGANVAVLRMDIDDFRAINGLVGHDNADDILRMVGDTMLLAAHRPNDANCRPGGDEFAIVLPGTHELGLKAVAEHLMSLVSEMQEKLPDDIKKRLQGRKITLSLGGSILKLPPKTPGVGDGEYEAQVIRMFREQPDTAAYFAKQDKDGQNSHYALFVDGMEIPEEAKQDRQQPTPEA